jgi:hypothetical protein
MAAAGRALDPLEPDELPVMPVLAPPPVVPPVPVPLLATPLLPVPLLPMPLVPVVERVPPLLPVWDVVISRI